MFDKVRLFSARALFALVVGMSLGFGLLVAGVAAILGVMTIAAFRIAMIGLGREAWQGSPKPIRSTAPNWAAQPA